MGIYKPVIDISGNAGSATKLANDSGVAPSYSCRAWVNFNGTGTIKIRSSGNVSSIVDLAVGAYTVNFTNAMPDVNYAVSLGQSDSNSGVYGANTAFNTNSTSLQYRVLVNTSNVYGPFDPTNVCLSVFR